MWLDPQYSDLFLPLLLREAGRRYVVLWGRSVDGLAARPRNPQSWSRAYKTMCLHSVGGLLVHRSPLALDDSILHNRPYCRPRPSRCLPPVLILALLERLLLRHPHRYQHFFCVVSLVPQRRAQCRSSLSCPACASSSSQLLLRGR